VASVVSILPWFVCTLGMICLSATVGFLLGIAWGINFATAKNLRDTPEETPQLLTPQLWSPERIAQAMQAEKNLPFDSPQTYNGPNPGAKIPRIPGLEDG
jgi:hypothetical protein